MYFVVLNYTDDSVDIKLLEEINPDNKEDFDYEQYMIDNYSGSLTNWIITESLYFSKLAINSIPN